MDPIRVLIVDDSPFMRKALERMLTDAPDLQVVGSARDGQDALEKIPQLKPDIVTLDAGRSVFSSRRGDALLDSWIFGAPSGSVASVWRAGRQVVKDGRLVARERVEARYRRALATVLG